MKLLVWFAVFTFFTAHAADQEQIKRGEYLTLAGNCKSCHTIDKTKPFAGGYPFLTPFGTVYGPNITPDPETGIGAWTDEEFVNAMRNGMGKNGKHLYPIFPYTAFSRLAHEDLLAIKAYLFSLPPVYQQEPENQFSFPLSLPFSQNFLLASWKYFNFTQEPWQVDSSKSAEYNRGMYLTEALAHCQRCHTPRNFTMGLDNERAFAGGSLDGWTAYNITSDHISGIGAWKDEELLRYFQTGTLEDKGAANGQMREVIEQSLQYLTEADLRAIIAYLRTRPAIRDAADQKARFHWGTKSEYDTALRGATPITNNTIASQGAELYSGNCASCHSSDGSGVNNHYPSLLNSTTVGASNPNNLIKVILYGVQEPSDAPDNEVLMPSFAQQLTDEQIAVLSNFVVQQYGNPNTPTITEQQVRLLRENRPSETPGVWSTIQTFFQKLWTRIASFFI